MKTVFVCFFQYEKPLSFSFPLRIFNKELEAQEWVKDQVINADPDETPKYVEIEIG